MSLPSEEVETLSHYQERLLAIEKIRSSAGDFTV
jgi:hypothetical protein